ncbi:uncharacterized protein At4g19900 [Lathyrus oleraceus]|uniref:Alpha 1,4-glycosyltransferase domain-containing protein n=1 Tax=Pisum sativum TaxID=3888 RepID=A0A9D4VPR2_PEA|nr:uncharacterized protein At4g19900 [Pisum sativum]KAI5387167.1 hypothetical protein KIW84_073354 [Pisum sativum]
MLRSRRRSPYGAYLCAVISAVLLLLSVSLLYSRLSLSHSDSHSNPRTLLSDTDDSDLSTSDPIDELDFIDLDQQQQQQQSQSLHTNPSSYFFDPITSSIRKSFKSPSIFSDSITTDDEFTVFSTFSTPEDRSKSAFTSDDIPLDDNIRRKATTIKSIEDLLLLKSSSLREVWGEWFDKKGMFLRKDKMLKSSFEAFNPMLNPLLQDPDSVGVSTLTRGDKILHKWWINEFKRVPFSFSPHKNTNNNGKLVTVAKGGTERRTLNDNSDAAEFLNHHQHIYADGNNWGYFPGLPLRLSFNGFMDSFFRKGKCVMRVFMVWNSPPWMFTVRYQRGLESLLFHHPNACVVVFSETIELDFFKDSFLKDGYKVAVVMPNLDQLLKGTPANIFSSVWFEWRMTKFYSTHYSELIRLAALYKYGGIYLDSDIIVLKPISFLNNSVGIEDHAAGSSLNGAVMAFGRHSLFIKKCLEEFYMTYDDNSLRWNGADLLTRVARKSIGEKNRTIKRLELNEEPSHIFFPINSQDIARYFVAPATETEKAQQDVLLERILRESLTFHFWNSLTSALIPEPDSLVARLMNYACIRCLELL